MKTNPPPQSEQAQDPVAELSLLLRATVRHVETLDNKVARLEHHFVTLDKQMSKQARRIEELEAAQARQGDSKRCV